VGEGQGEGLRASFKRHHTALQKRLSAKSRPHPLLLSQRGNHGRFPRWRVEQIRRGDRASYDRAAIHALLDEAMVAHVGFIGAAGPSSFR